jgi:hypothetical protein
MSVRGNPIEDEKTDPGHVPEAARHSLVPWGLLVVLAVYAAAATGYSTWHLWSSDDYQAARHYKLALERLGPSGGKTAPREALVASYEDLLEAARRVPEVRDFHDQLESLNWRFEERHWAIPGDLRERAEAVATIYVRIQQAQRPLLAVGARDRGWDPDQLLAEPTRLLFFGLLGAAGIVAIWVYMRLGERARLKAAQAEKQDELLREVAEIERNRATAVRRAVKPASKAQPRR